MPRPMALIACLATIVSLPATAAETRHTVILAGNKAGIQTTNVAADSAREVSYEFTDRGRGPKITTRIQVNAAGTDDLPGFTLHRELEMYVQAGISAPETLRIATLNGAKVLKRDADLVVKDGKVYEVGALYRSIGMLPR